jgi:hypothetical protein
MNSEVDLLKVKLNIKNEKTKPEFYKTGFSENSKVVKSPTPQNKYKNIFKKKRIP